MFLYFVKRQLFRRTRTKLALIAHMILFVHAVLMIVQVHHGVRGERAQITQIRVLFVF